MRLLTFQNKNCLSVLDKGVWYSNYGTRMKCIDYDYADIDKDIYPLYTFASTGNLSYPYFGLPEFFSSWNHYVGFMQFDPERIVLVELEVPESFILSMKQMCYWFEQECAADDPAMELQRKGRYYKRDLSQGPIYHEDYLAVVRQNRSAEFEALIPCLKKEHIAAIREFTCSGSTYDTVECKTTYVNEGLCPLWFDTVYVNGDGYPRYFKDAVVKELVEDIEKRGSHPLVARIVQGVHGAKRVPDYFTIAEALACGDSAILSSIKYFAQDHGWLNPKDRSWQEQPVSIMYTDKFDVLSYVRKQIGDIPAQYVPMFKTCKTKLQCDQLIANLRLK